MKKGLIFLFCVIGMNMLSARQNLDGSNSNSTTSSDRDKSIASGNNNPHNYTPADIVRILNNTTWCNKKKEYLYDTNTWWSFEENDNTLTCRTTGDILYQPSEHRKDLITQLIDVINKDKITLTIVENTVTINYKAYVVYQGIPQYYDIEIKMVVLSENKIVGTIKRAGTYNPIKIKKCEWRNCTSN